LEIETNVPIPSIASARSVAGKLVERMLVGNSVLCGSEEEKEAVRACGNHRGYKMCTRKVDGGWRVWRVE
jgi:hypothetical protein